MWLGLSQHGDPAFSGLQMGPPEVPWQFRLAPEQFYLLSLVLGCGICSFLLRHPAARLASPDEASEMLSQDLLVNAPHSASLYSNCSCFSW